MKGIIAAGSEFAARAGVEVLEKGGNAVSAAIAACFATSASEPSLVSLAGGGVMLMYNKKKKLEESVNFFGNMPGLGLSVEALSRQDFYPVEIDFSSATQVFKVGRGSAAPTGALLAFCELASSHGNLPLEELISPSLSALQDGLYLGEKQTYMKKVLRPIYSVTKEAEDLFFPKGKEGFFRNEKTASFLGRLTDRNWKEIYDKEFYQKILEEFSPKKGGLMTKEDLEAFKLLFLEPLSGNYKGSKILTAPKPACGGEFILAALSQYESVSGRKETDLEKLSYVFHSLSEMKARGEKDFLSKKSKNWLHQHLEKNFGRPFHSELSEKQERSSTTHVSVIDGERTCVSVTFSHGEGCGHLVGNTGIMMNNFVGEDDVAPCGYESSLAGERLPTMVAPSIMEKEDGSLFVLGSGGANRIRSSLVQVILNLLDEEMAPEEAVRASRIHVENSEVSTEYNLNNSRLDALLRKAKPTKTNLFAQKDVYFGGVNLVTCDPLGNMKGAGDPRRGGFCLKVD